MAHAPDRISTELGSLIRSSAHGTMAGAIGGLLVPFVFPELADLIAAQSRPLLAYGLLAFLCSQIGLTAGFLAVILDFAASDDGC